MMLYLYDLFQSNVRDTILFFKKNQGKKAVLKRFIHDLCQPQKLINSIHSFQVFLTVYQATNTLSKLCSLQIGLDAIMWKIFHPLEYISLQIVWQISRNGDKNQQKRNL